MQESKVLDPTSMGLFGLAIVTLVTSSAKLGITHGVSGALPWAIFLGAAIQLFAAVIDAKKGNVFGMTAFAAFGCFWLGVSLHWLISLNVLGDNAQSTLDGHQIGVAFLGYSIFCVYMTVAAFTVSKAMTILFLFIDALLISMTLHSFGINPELNHEISAYSEALTSLMSFYMAAALMLNERFKKTLLPLGSAIIKV